MTDDYAADLERNGIEACRSHPYAFGRFPGGEAIPDLVRRAYREDFPWDEPHPDLWTPEGEAFIVDWLNRPAPEYGRQPWVTRLAATLYRLRPDLQSAFPDVGGKHGKSFAHWFVEHAAVQERFPAMFVTPVRDALAGRATAAPSTALRTGHAAKACPFAPRTTRGVLRSAVPGAAPIAWRTAWPGACAAR